MNTLSQLWLRLKDVPGVNDDVKSARLLRSDHPTSVQGFMSGSRLGKSPTVHDGLDLKPVTFDLICTIAGLLSPLNTRAS